jgi:5-methylcytosine-specific restriction protein A
MVSKSDLTIGQIVSNAELIEAFKCGNMGGMRRSRKTNSLVLISDPFKALYRDRWLGDVFHYTGMGKNGDQVIQGNQNKTLAESDSNGVEVFLFEVFTPKEYTFRGQVHLAEQPYQETQLGENGQPRKVWVFPLKAVAGLASLTLPESTYAQQEERLVKQAQKLSHEELKRRAKQAPRKPGTSQTSSQQYARDPHVTAFAKRRANGICQLCGNPAPFLSPDGEPYLECHHVIWLAQGGEDSIENTVALCPNCHRRVHVKPQSMDVQRLKKVALQGI